jgi:hypothetical protein
MKTTRLTALEVARWAGVEVLCFRHHFTGWI